jgi:hypothetical protein
MFVGEIEANGLLVIPSMIDPSGAFRPTLDHPGIAARLPRLVRSTLRP